VRKGAVASLNVRMGDDTPGAALQQFRAVSVFPGNLTPAQRHFTALADLMGGAPVLVQHLKCRRGPRA